MPAYSFEAMDAAGVTRKGVLEADTARAARGMLRAQALVPLSVEQVSSGQNMQSQATGYRRRVWSATGLAVWTRQMAGLVTSGLSLERALTALLEEAEDERQRVLMAALRSDVNAGASFAKALQEHPKDFSGIYTAVIGAGEQGGNLGMVLDSLADDLEARQALKARLVAAALYPAIVCSVAIVIVVFLLTYVVPQVAEVFASGHKALPLLTSAMMAISAFVRSYGWVLLLALAGAAVALRMAYASPSTRLRMDAALLRVPVMGRLARGYNAARFAATLAMLAGAGVPILRALQAAGDTLPNSAMRADAQEALVLVREGAPLASALAQKKRFPGLLSMFARLGEQTGELPLMLQRAAHQLSAEVTRRAMQLATVLEPLLILAMGLIVMMIVLAVMLPIIQMNQMVR